MIKAVIPVAGVGTKLRPHTHTQPKPLIPVAGKPILGHIVDSVLETGVTDFVFIIGYLGEKIKEYVRETYRDRIQAEFVVQAPRKGLGHAIWVAREALTDCEEILVILGDTIFDVDLHAVLSAPCSTMGVQVVEDPRNFGVAVLDEEGYITGVKEKPRIPKSNLALVGLYRIKEVAVLMEGLDEIIREKRVGDRGEYQLTDGLMHLVEEGVRLRTHTVDNWFDCGRRDMLLYTNQLLLQRRSHQETYDFPNTVVLPPVHIDPSCVIENSIIGPNVAIAENAEIRNSIVRNSILGAYSQLDSIVLDHSVIGNDAALKGKSHSVNIGDNNEIDFNA